MNNPIILWSAHQNWRKYIFNLDSVVLDTSLVFYSTCCCPYDLWFDVTKMISVKDYISSLMLP